MIVDRSLNYQLRDSPQRATTSFIGINAHMHHPSMYCLWRCLCLGQLFSCAVVSVRLCHVKPDFFNINFIEYAVLVLIRPAPMLRER